MAEFYFICISRSYPRFTNFLQVIDRNRHSLGIHPELVLLRETLVLIQWYQESSVIQDILKVKCSWNSHLSFPIR